MKKIYNLRTLFAMCLVTSLGFLTSCDNEDEDSNSGQVVLLSMGPSGVKHGEKIKFIGENLDKVTSIVLPGIEVQKSEFSSVTREVLELVVPTEAMEGRVKLMTPDGELESKSILSFEVPVTITSVSPAEAKPGTEITITGDYVNWLRGVTFADGVPATEVVSVSLTEVVVKVPMGAQTGRLIFFTGGTEPLQINSDSELIVTLPTISSVAPLALKHEDELTITGTDLDLVTEVAFAGDVSTMDFISQTEEKIVVKVPVGATQGKVTLKQASPVNVVSTEDLTIILPIGSALAPKPAIPGETDITITGTNLDLVATLTFVSGEGTVDVEAAGFKSQSATQIVLTLPEDAIAGGVTYTTIHGYTKSLGVSVTIPSEGPPPLDYYIFDDVFKNGWSAWGGWDVTEDFASTEEVFVGTKVIKATYSGQWGAVQIGAPENAPFADYTTFTFRVYVAAGQNFIVQLNDAADYNVTLQTGWNLVEIPVGNMAGKDAVAELRLKNNNAGTPVTLYFDEIGLKN
jgi:hypothetical protein